MQVIVYVVLIQINNGSIVRIEYCSLRELIEKKSELVSA